ncbi:MULTISPECIES: hypothetical protein [Pseudomonas]|uniref:Uncharacterized protein n=1 Tax=Pseudomonas fluorescens TaxID=294 RepID=A0A5E6VYZ3_PSEFL|nr:MULTISPECIES: hypothetical protein [Pseudomonas]VVN21633.1 hypothetical protein PS652_04351 [Pseudomonas fluorescens]
MHWLEKPRCAALGALITLLAALHLGPFTGVAQASVVDITAEYIPSHSGRPPSGFVNTTPQAAFCSGLVVCAASEYRYTVNLPLSFSTAFIHRAPNPRDTYFFRLPSTRTLNLVNEHGESFSAQFRPTHFGLRIVPGLTVHVAGGTSGACENVGLIEDRTATQYVGRVNPQVLGGCYMNARSGSAGAVVNVDSTVQGLAFELQLPSPITLKNGLYRAQLQLSVGGNGADLDLGNRLTSVSTDLLTLNFEFTVKHPLKIEFPAGSERAVLEPPGGWAGWINRGSPPQRLYRVVPFRIWTTGAISVHTRCEYDLGGRCGIRGRGGHQVPLKVALTLPASMRHLGAPVDNLVLPVGAPASLTIETVEATLDRQARLLFEVNQADTASMLMYPGETFQGDVTLVLDAAL